MSVYPNPSAGLFNLAMDIHNERTVTVRVFDLSGKLILSREINVVNGLNNYMIDMGTASNGLYQVVVSGSSSKMATRIIKQ